MTLSRTSRILIGVLLLAVAAFLWMNVYFGEDSNPFLQAAPVPVQSPAAMQVPATSIPEAGNVPAVAPASQLRVAREFEVLDLPFLITEPPVEGEQLVEEERQETDAAASAGRRAGINPFAPILRPETQSAQAQSEPAPMQPVEVVTEVPVPAGPPAPGAVITSPAPSVQAAPKAPAPAAVAPVSSVGSAPLPRAMPSGTIGGTPSLLTSAIGNRVPAAQETATLASAERDEPIAEEPAEETVAARPEAPTASESPEATVSTPEAEPVAMLPVTGPPIEAGTSELSRYLRDNDVRFTGSVIGPVSVGVFRSSQTPAPIVISLGQSLPDTSIVLTDLRGQQAEFTLGERTQALTLELRR